MQIVDKLVQGAERRAVKALIDERHWRCFWGARLRGFGSRSRARRQETNALVAILAIGTQTARAAK
jgi:hypothetical protein